MYGSAAFVSGAFGLGAAAAVVQRLTGLSSETPRVLSDQEAARRRKKARA